jgi:hypothetical protein
MAHPGWQHHLLLHEPDDHRQLKQKSSGFAGGFLLFIYEVGGNGSSLTGVAAGFFRNIANPTPNGVAIKSKDKHKNTNPMVVAAAGSLLPNTSMSAPGVMPAIAIVEPKKHKNKPGHPHNNTAAIVAIIPFVLLSIFLSFCESIFSSIQKTKKGCKKIPHPVGTTKASSLTL